VKKALSSPETIKAVLQSRHQAVNPQTLENELQAARREINRPKKQERNLIYLYRVGEYDEELLGVETKRLKEAQRKAVMRYEELQDQQLKISQLTERMESIETYCDWASRNLERLDFDQKRLVLEALDIQVTVDDNKVMIRGFLPVVTPAFSPESPLSSIGKGSGVWYSRG